jgi:hypothetical protein
MPSVSSDDAGLEDRESDFFDQQESEKVEAFTSVTPACSVNKVPTASNVSSVC